MKFVQLKSITYDVKYVGFKVPAYPEDFTYSGTHSLSEFNQFNENENTLECLIDIDTGTVIGYTANMKIDIFDKCVDEGIYALYDENMNVICEYEDYVPNIFEVNENGYGDYLNLTINPDGTIVDWKDHIDELGITVFDEWNKNNT